MSELAQSLNDATKKRDNALKVVKLSILGIVSSALIALTWWLMNLAVYGHMPLNFWFWVIGSSVLWCAFVSFFVLVNPYTWLFALTNAFAFGAYMFIMPKNLFVALGGVIFFLLSVLFQRRMVTEEKNQQHFSIRRTISSSVLVATYGFLFVIGFNVYNFVNQDFKDDPDKFYDRIGAATSRGVPFVSDNFQGINLNQPLDEYLADRVESNLPEGLDQASPAVKDEYVQDYRDQFLEQFGLQDSAKVSLGRALAKIVNQKGREVLQPYNKYLPLFFALVIFGLLRTFSFIFNWLTIFVTWLLFRILYMTNFFKLTKAVVEVDKLDLW